MMMNDEFVFLGVVASALARYSHLCLCLAKFFFLLVLLSKFSKCGQRCSFVSYYMYCLLLAWVVFCVAFGFLLG